MNSESGASLPAPAMLDVSVSGVMDAFPWACPALAVTPVVHRVAFDAATFDASVFSRAGMACPPHISQAVRKRQAEYFHGRSCARAALSAYGHHGDVGTGPAREPLWPEGMVGSITHGATLAAAVALPAAACRGIGIDIEQVSATNLDALRSTVVSATEYALLASLAGPIDIGILLTLVFSAKESFFKATYATVGHYFEFDAIALHAIDLAGCQLTFVVTAPLCADWPAGKPLRVHYTLAPEGRVATLFAW